MKYLCTMICSLAIPFLGFSQDVSNDTGDMGETPALIQSVPSKPVPTYSIALKIEPLSQEQTQAGVTNELIQSLIQKKLDEAGIALNPSIQQPMLILRVRSIQTGLDIATFFQLSLQEDSMLVRNRSLFQAVTWSQASLLACRPEDLKKEVVETIDMMIQAFTKDYMKALQM